MYFLKSSLNCDEFIRAIVASPDTAEDAFYLQMQKGALDGVKIQTGGSECATNVKLGVNTDTGYFSFKIKLSYLSGK